MCWREFDVKRGVHFSLRAPVAGVRQQRESGTSTRLGLNVYGCGRGRRDMIRLRSGGKGSSDGQSWE
jgi:hypothetical protein